MVKLPIHNYLWTDKGLPILLVSRKQSSDVVEPLISTTSHRAGPPIRVNDPAARVPRPAITTAPLIPAHARSPRMIGWPVTSLGGPYPPRPRSKPSARSISLMRRRLCSHRRRDQPVFHGCVQYLHRCPDELTSCCQAPVSRPARGGYTAFGVAIGPLTLLKTKPA